MNSKQMAERASRGAVALQIADGKHFLRALRETESDGDRRLRERIDHEAPEMMTKFANIRLSPARETRQREISSFLVSVRIIEKPEGRLIRFINQRIRGMSPAITAETRLQLLDLKSE